MINYTLTKLRRVRTKDQGREKEAEYKAILDSQIKALKLPPMIDEFKFHSQRRWRFDRANVQMMIAIEIEGGIWSGGRHIRGVGFSQDCEKYNDALAMGWRVLRVTPEMVKNGKAVQWYEALVALRKMMKTGELPSPMLMDVIDPLPSQEVWETASRISGQQLVRKGPIPQPQRLEELEVPSLADDLTPDQVLALFPSPRKRRQSK